MFNRKIDNEPRQQLAIFHFSSPSFGFRSKPVELARPRPIHHSRGVQVESRGLCRCSCTIWDYVIKYFDFFSSINSAVNKIKSRFFLAQSETEGELLGWKFIALVIREWKLWEIIALQIFSDSHCMFHVHPSLSLHECCRREARRAKQCWGEGEGGKAVWHDPPMRFIHWKQKLISH